MAEAKTVNQAGIIEKAHAEAVEAKKPKTLKDFVQQMEGQFAKALPKVITPDRFTRIALTALSSNLKLMECDRNSFLGALMNAAQLGLEPNTPLGQAYLIPFRNNKRNITECQFQIGYKGLLDLAYRSGEVSTVQAQIVYEKDRFEYELGLEPKLVHVPADGERGAAVRVYAVFKLKNGGYSFDVMSMEDVKKHAQKYSKSFASGPWQTNFEEMAKKTVLKKVLKYAPIRSDFLVNAVQTDDSASKYDMDANEFIINTETGEIIDEPNEPAEEQA